MTAFMAWIESLDSPAFADLRPFEEIALHVGIDSSAAG
jgi:hypothetical protein